MKMGPVQLDSDRALAGQTDHARISAIAAVVRPA